MGDCSIGVVPSSSSCYFHFRCSPNSLRVNRSNVSRRLTSQKLNRDTSIPIVGQSPPSISTKISNSRLSFIRQRRVAAPRRNEPVMMPITVAGECTQLTMWTNMKSRQTCSHNSPEDEFRWKLAITNGRRWYCWPKPSRSTSLSRCGKLWQGEEGFPCANLWNGSLGWVN